MKFRIWFENEPPETQKFNFRNPPEGPDTIEYMPDNEEGWGIDTIRAFDQILNIARQIDPTIPNPNGVWQPEIRKPNGSVDSDAFIGTPDYSSPEQSQTKTYKNSLDNYQRVLLRNIPQFSPELAQEAKELAKLWTSFRNKLVYKANMQESSQTYRPIHYAIPLQELQRVLATLRQLGQVIGKDAETRELAAEYQELYKRHVTLMKKIGPTLKQKLNVARQNPFG